MKLILNIYGHNEIMHVKFYWGVISKTELMPFDRLNFNDVFPSSGN